MATPAEIIAARVNGTYVADMYDEPSSAASSPQPPSPNGSARSVKDESAFPVLGGKSSNVSSSTAGSWGPNVAESAVFAAVAAPALAASGAAKPASNGKFKGSTIQEAFSLDAEDQLNVARPEFIKILTSIKTSTAASIECTTSQHTKKRTFLITGKPDQVKLAKRLVIKKLTKPVSVTFAIPAVVRSKVIGAQGRTLKPIIQQNEVKIDIGHVDDALPADDDDVYTRTINITIDGDAEGCKQAKNQILAIVKEETKNIQIKLVVDDLVKPFVTNAILSIVAQNPDVDFSIPPYDSSSKSVFILGERDAALLARDQIKQILSSLESKLVTELVPIPKVKHQFLPIDTILEEVNVLIKLPQEGETDVKFIGEKKNIAAAQEKARKTTSQYKVEVLDMSKAHKGNLPHVRAVAAMLNKYGKFAEIENAHDVKINPPSVEFLQDESATTIPVEIIVKDDDAEKTKNARRAVVTAVNKVTTDQTKHVTDIDSFFLSEVPQKLSKVENARFVILGETVVLFDSDKEQNEDFDDFEETVSDILGASDKALDSLRELHASLKTTVLPVPSAKQSAVSGPKGSTLRSILASVEGNSVIVKLHANASGPSDNEILVKGLKADVDVIAAAIKEVLAEAEEYKETGGYKTTLDVPSFIMSRIIGKGGSNVKAIEDEFGVRVDIAGEAGKDSDADKSAKSEITISGIKRNAEEAKNALAKLAKKLADDTLVRLKIEAQFHRRIVGPSFTYINRLQDKYNVKIRFPSESNSGFADAPSNKDEVTIRGASKNVAKAEEELKELYQFEKENGFKTTIQIPVKAVARVIGKNGETIGDISDGTGVDYRFNRNRDQEEETGFAEVEFTGSKSALKEATQKVQAIIDEVENTITVTINVNPKYHRDLVGPSGSVLRAMISKAGGDDLTRQQYSRLLTIPNSDSDSDEIVCQGDKAIVNKLIEQIKAIVDEKESSVTEEYQLAKEKHKLIIGPGGSIRHSLQDEFGVQISIPRPSEDSTVIALHGLTEKIAKLKEKLDELTKDNWNESIDVPLEFHSLVSDRGAIIKALRLDQNVEVGHGNLTRKASNLSNALIPAPPEGADAEEGETTKLTVRPFAAESAADGSIPWRLIGSADATAAAAKIIKDQLERAKSATSVGWVYSSDPKNHFPRIIGPQGSRIKKIRQQTGAFITVPRSNEKYHNYIYLVGTEESLQSAHEQLRKLI